MKMRVSKTMGGTGFSIEADIKNELDFFKVSSFYTSMPSACGSCQSTSIAPAHKENKGYEFFFLKCLDCGHEYKYGQKKAGGLYPKGGWVEPYSGGGDDSQYHNQAGPSNVAEEDIPF